MKVIAFDYYDKDRLKPIKLKLKETNVKKNSTFKKEDVTYRVTKVFSKKGVEGKCIEIRMVAYKIPNTVTTHAHRCPAKKGFMDRMQSEQHEVLEKKYGKFTVDAWKKGKVKMKIGEISSICPDCECLFWKEKNELPEGMDIISLKGKKRLVKRK